VDETRTELATPSDLRDAGSAGARVERDTTGPRVAPTGSIRPLASATGRAPAVIGARPVLLLNGCLREALQAFQLVPVVHDPLLADRRQRDIGVGLLADKPLLDLDQTGFLQLRQVTGEVSLGQPRGALQKTKSAVCTEDSTVRIASRPGSWISRSSSSSSLRSDIAVLEVRSGRAAILGAPADRSAPGTAHSLDSSDHIW